MIMVRETPQPKFAGEVVEFRDLANDVRLRMRKPHQEGFFLIWALPNETSGGRPHLKPWHATQTSFVSLSSSIGFCPIRAAEKQKLGAIV